MIEEWKDLPGFNGKYQVSNLGNVRTINRVCNTHNGGSYIRKGCMLKLVINNRGYYHLNLWDSEKNKAVNLRVHIMVAMTFLGHDPCGMKVVVDHIDSNKLNNRVDNLQLTTQRINSSKSLRKTSSKYVGVSFDKVRNKWMSSIYCNGKRKHLGRYNCELVAHVAYIKELNKLNERVY